MVINAQVRAVDIKNNSITIYVPTLEEYDSESEYGEKEVPFEFKDVSICTTAGCYPNYQVGDNIFICIEDNYLTKPVIIGKAISNESTDVGTSNGTFNTLIAEGAVTLSKDTQIGDVQSENISHLKNSTGNIQNQIDETQTRHIQSLDYWTDKLKNAFTW